VHHIFGRYTQERTLCYGGGSFYFSSARGIALTVWDAVEIINIIGYIENCNAFVLLTGSPLCLKMSLIFFVFLEPNVLTIYPDRISGFGSSAAAIWSTYRIYILFFDHQDKRDAFSLRISSEGLETVIGTVRMRLARYCCGKYNGFLALAQERVDQSEDQKNERLLFLTCIPCVEAYLAPRKSDTGSRPLDSGDSVIGHSDCSDWIRRYYSLEPTFLSHSRMKLQTIELIIFVSRYLFSRIREIVKDRGVKSNIYDNGSILKIFSDAEWLFPFDPESAICDCCPLWHSSAEAQLVGVSEFIVPSSPKIPSTSSQVPVFIFTTTNHIGTTSNLKSISNRIKSTTFVGIRFVDGAKHCSPSSFKIVTEKNPAQKLTNLTEG
jgi:hypothetical protein